MERNGEQAQSSLGGEFHNDEKTTSGVAVDGAFEAHGQTLTSRRRFFKIYLYCEAAFCLQKFLDYKLENWAYMSICGSTLFGNATASSDLDICLFTEVPLENGFEVCRKEQLKFLAQVKDILLNESSVISSVLLIPARVPTVQCVMKNFPGLIVNINFGLVASVYNSHLLFHYAMIDHRYVALNLLVKKWALNCNVCNSRMGLLNSYSLALMVVNYLQCGTSPFSPVFPSLQQLFPTYFTASRSVDELFFFSDLLSCVDHTNTQCLGDLLLGFFRYYSQVVDFSKQVISVRLGRCVNANHGQHIFIEDPYQGTSTSLSVTSQAAVLYIKARFKDAFNDLLFNQNFEIL
ncbi:PAP assoc domain containing protein [Trichuris trichiura]|uniref:PAP assoc domain containing protein n=1 Tax=Trichuris trichiura TaxID=36087 RepID=A0A077Z460_TRITR|nr:PAP assoc domain containing protein [Trichuris trichiura]